MNERHPYEQLIATKLKQLPVPDREKSWRQMKQLLDNDPTRGGGGKKGFRPGNGWWWGGLAAIILTAGIWLLYERKDTPAKTANTLATAKREGGSSTTAIPGSPAKNAVTSRQTIPASSLPAYGADNTKINQNNTIDPNATLNDNSITATTVTSKQNAAVTVPRGPASGNDKSNAIRRTIPNNRITGTINSNTPAITRSLPGLKSSKKNPAYNSNAYAVKNDAYASLTAGKPIGCRVAGAGNSSLADILYSGRPGDKNDKSRNLPGKTKNSGIYNTNTTTPAREQQDALFTGGLIVIPYSSGNTGVLAGDSINENYDANHLLSKDAKALAKKNQRNQAVTSPKPGKERNGLQLGKYFQPFSLKNSGDAWWAVGLALNSSLSVGAQTSVGYNVNARSGTISDYIPSPYVQFHLNDNVYLQTELNLSAPQNTPQLLMARSIREQPGTTDKTESSLYIQKLYYFNWPFSLHYSPLRNLYFSGGLQFSSLQSGVALSEERRLYGGTSAGPVYNSNIYKFKDDTTAGRLSPNEWRWQTGADYYWNRFTLGFRYNKAFKDLVDLQVPGSYSPTINRNAAFLLFMKYNLFEGRKKEDAKTPESLVRY